MVFVVGLSGCLHTSWLATNGINTLTRVSFSPRGFYGFCLKISEKVWKFRKLFLSLHRQDKHLGYPGKFPERASRNVTTHLKAAHLVRFYFFYLRKLFIIIFRKPLLVAIFRLMEISLLPVNIKTSTAPGDISKCRLISSVILRIP